MVTDPRKDFGQRLPRELPRGRGHQFDLWMPQKQPHEFLAGIPGSADHGHPRSLRIFHDAQCVLRLGAIATKD
jgi:hypothetical protein